MSTNNYTATNAAGVTYALVYSAAQGLDPAFYTLSITDPGGLVTTVSDIPPNNVLTSDGTLNTLSLLGVQNYVIPPGVTGTIDALADVLGTNNIYVAGTAIFSALADVGSSTAILVDGGALSLAAGTVAAALGGSVINLEHGGSFANGAGVLSALTGSTINFGTGGGTFIANAGGALVDLSGTTITGFTNSVDQISFTNLEAPLDHYSIADAGAAAQTITLYDAANQEIGSVTLAGTSLPVGTVGQGQSGPLTISAAGTTITIDPGTSVLVCFLAGTRIATPDGEVAVEALEIGDPVLTADGGTVPIVWIGRTSPSSRFHDPRRVMPVRIAAGALDGDDAHPVPMRDLLVSPDHAMFLDGVLVPALLLVNGTSIVQEARYGVLDYYHVEIEPHDIILAEGAPTESYLDTGNRGSFVQAGRVATLRSPTPRSWEDACAPLVLTGPALDRIRSRLGARAGLAALVPPSLTQAA